MTVPEIRAGLRVLAHYYAVKGEPHALNDVQVSVYLDGLAQFTAPELEAASRQWMRTSRWFPALSDLLSLMAAPVASPAEQAALAWSAVERAVRQVGAYRGVLFADPAIGETVRQVFGTWPRACSYESDSPGLHGRRQQFLVLYPMIAKRSHLSSVLGGIHRDKSPALVAHVEGLPEPKLLTEGTENPPPSSDEARVLLASLQARASVSRPRS